MEVLLEENGLLDESKGYKGVNPDPMGCVVDVMSQIDIKKLAKDMWGLTHHEHGCDLHLKGEYQNAQA